MDLDDGNNGADNSEGKEEDEAGGSGLVHEKDKNKTERFSA
jgi:hypothetical protein